MNGIERITAERVRQMTAEGWTPEHDDTHDESQLAITAACYAVNETKAQCITISPRASTETIDAWPLDCCTDKRRKHSRIRQLEIAGALIAAEIDRLQRKS